MASDDSEINVKVTATTEGLTSGLNKATGDVKDFGNQINDLAQRVASVKPDAFKALAEEFNAGKLDLDEFRDGLMAVTTASSAAATESVALAEASHLSAGGMRELVVVGRELASGNLTRLPGSLSILATRLNLLSPAGILAAAGIAAVGYAIYEAIESSQKFESELATIQNSLTAVGQGNSFDRGAITEYVNQLRQIPGIDQEAASSIVNEFARAGVSSASTFSEMTTDLEKFGELIGKKTPDAAKDFAAAMRDPVRGLELLKAANVEVSATTQEQITQMMSVNNLAGAQKTFLDGIADALSHMVDQSTGLDRLFNNLEKNFSGINIEAAQARDKLLDEADALDKVGDAESRLTAQFLRRQAAEVGGEKARNIPRAVPSGAAPQDPAKQAAIDHEAEVKKNNDAISVTNKMFDTGNSLLREQEVHKQNILNIQQGINAAEATGNEAALKRAYADLETENKRYYGEPKQPKDDSDKYAEAQVKAESEAGLARIKTEQDVTNEKMRLGEISTVDAVKELKDLAEQEHEINLKRIADMRAVYARQGDRAGVATSDGDAAKENERFSQQDSKIDTQGAEATKKSQEAEMEGDRRVADEKVRTAQVANEQKVALGQMSAQQEIQAEIEAANQKHALDDAYYASLLQHEAQDSAAYQKTLADKLVAEQKFEQQVLQLKTKALQQQQQQENQLTKSLTNGLNQTVSGVLQGTQTMGQAFQRMGSNIVLSVVDGALDKILTKFLSNNSTIQAAQTALDSFLGISNEANATDSITTAQTEAHANIIAYAGEGAAAAVASTAAIPLVGPELAPEAGAAIYGDIMSYNIASAAGGMVVDSDQIAKVHENEMILPAHLSQGIAGMIANGQTGGGGGHTFNTTVHANGRLNAGDLDGLHDAVVSTMKKAARNGQFGGMRGG